MPAMPPRTLPIPLARSRRRFPLGPVAAACLWVGAAGFVRAGSDEGYDFNKWEWSRSDLHAIEEIEEDLEKADDGFWEIRFRDEWLEVRTDVSPRFTAEFARFMLIFVEEFPEIFPVDPKGRVMVTLRAKVFSNEAKYAAATGMAGSRGVFIWRWTGRGFDIFDLNGYAENEGEHAWKNFGIKVLQHEGAHAMLQKYVGRDIIPVFFNEGVATYFENWCLGQSIGENIDARAARSPRWRWLEKAYDREDAELPDLKESVLMDRETWDAGGDREKLLLHYALAESFTDLLVSHKKYRKYFKQMMRNLYRLKRSRDGRFDLLSDKRWRRLEHAWHDHIRELIALHKKGRAEAETKPAAD